MTIEKSAFRGCRSLKHVVFPDDSVLESIEDECFVASEIEEFLAPPSLKRIGASAFSECKRLRKVVLNEGLDELNSSFKGSEVEVV